MTADIHVIPPTADPVPALVTDQSFDAAYDGLDRRLAMLRMDLADIRRRLVTADKMGGWRADIEPLKAEIAAELRGALAELER